MKQKWTIRKKLIDQHFLKEKQYSDQEIVPVARMVISLASKQVVTPVCCVFVGFEDEPINETTPGGKFCGSESHREAFHVVSCRTYSCVS